MEQKVGDEVKETETQSEGEEYNTENFNTDEYNNEEYNNIEEEKPKKKKESKKQSKPTVTPQAEDNNDDTYENTSLPIPPMKVAARPVQKSESVGSMRSPSSSNSLTTSSKESLSPVLTRTGSASPTESRRTATTSSSKTPVDLDYDNLKSDSKSEYYSGQSLKEHKHKVDSFDMLTNPIQVTYIKLCFYLDSTD